MEKRVIFTDLDGTLLDSKYSFKSARLGLEVVKKQEIPLVIVSSKTRAEIEVYRKKLGNIHPFVSENGGAIFIPKNYFHEENKARLSREYRIIELGTKYDKLVGVLKKIGKKVKVKGFSDMSVKELSKDSGLSLKEAQLAKKREYDEAFKLENKKDGRLLIGLVRKHKLHLMKGGKYYHILGGNDKGKAVRILMDFYKEKYGNVMTIGLGDAENDKKMLDITDKSCLISGPRDWNKIVVDFLGMNKGELLKGEELYWKSIDVLKKLQLRNGAILASPPNSRYPYVYPRDHSVCILGLIDAGLFKRARKGLNFILKTQKGKGFFPQRLDRKGKNKSYKPAQLDNTALVLYAFAKYVKKSGDKKFLKENRFKIDKSVTYLKSQFNKKFGLFFTLNSIHEFPPYETGLEVWSNAVGYAALKELHGLGFKFNLDKLKSSIEKYFWNGDYFIKNIRLGESSSGASDIDASSYAIADFGVLGDNNLKIKSLVREIEKELWHSKLGGICRYKKYIGRNNGGHGPWPHFTLMLARHWIRLGNKRKADMYLNWIFKIAYNGLLPEHIAEKDEFEEWVGEYKRAGILRKDREIMLRNIRKSEMFRKKRLAYSVLPLAWPHAEFIRTWNLYKKKFLD